MKKEYIEPSIEMILLPTRNILAGSGEEESLTPVDTPEGGHFVGE